MWRVPNFGGATMVAGRGKAFAKTLPRDRRKLLE